MIDRRVCLALQCIVRALVSLSRNDYVAKNQLTNPYSSKEKFSDFIQKGNKAAV